jgi:hypothetical protein
MNQLVDGALVAALVTFVISLAQPLIESLPGLSDTLANKARHDAVLRLANVLCNIAGVAAVLASTRALTSLDVLPIILQGVLQASGSHFLYRVVAGPPSVPSDVSAFPPGVNSFAGLGLPTTSAANSTPQQQ